MRWRFFSVWAKRDKKTSLLRGFSSTGTINYFCPWFNSHQEVALSPKPWTLHSHPFQVPHPFCLTALTCSTSADKKSLSLLLLNRDCCSHSSLAHFALPPPFLGQWFAELWAGNQLLRSSTDTQKVCDCANGYYWGFRTSALRGRVQGGKELPSGKGLLMRAHQVCRICCTSSSKAAAELAEVLRKPVSPTSTQGKNHGASSLGARNISYLEQVSETWRTKTYFSRRLA